MDARIFRPEPMDLRAALLDLGLADRISYDAERNTLFLNFEGCRCARSRTSSWCAAVEERCRAIGRRVALVVNYDGFELDPEVADAYAAMVADLQERYYTPVALHHQRLPAPQARRRPRPARVAPHVFEDLEEAHAAAPNPTLQHRSAEPAPPPPPDHPTNHAAKLAERLRIWASA